MDPWHRQAIMNRQVRVWGAGSVVGGLALAAVGMARQDGRLRAFGLQNAGWGAIDYVIGVLAQRALERKLARTPDPSAPETQLPERRKLRRWLLIAIGSDVGYVWSGWAWRRRRGGRDAVAVGNGVAVMVQGGFLLVFDAVHAALLSGVLRRRPPAAAPTTPRPRLAGPRPR